MKLLVREVIDETLGALKAAGALTFEAIPPYNIEVPKNWSPLATIIPLKPSGMTVLT